MALDVSSIQTASLAPLEGQRRAPAVQDGAVAGEPKRPIEVPSDLKATIRDLQRISEAFNRRLTFTLNEKLGQVVVKVIDNDTDKVVREIPPTELQHVYERIREVLGVLFDKSA
jgi:flagellar protein FlaG